MRARVVFVSLALTLAVPGCSRDPVDPSGDVDIRGLTDQQAAEIVSETLCTKMAQCPMEECSCYAQPDSPTVCECEIIYTEQTECTEEMYDEILSDLQSVELSAADEQQVNDCVNAYRTLSCLSEAQVQANVDAIEAGEDPPYEHEIPMACEQLEEIFSQEPTPTDPETPIPQPGG